MKRCDICLDPACDGKKDCHCETCKIVESCHRSLSPTIRITTKCTQSCSHCCFSCSPKKDDMMDVETAIKIGKFIKSNDIHHAQIMGGEFFCNPNWVEILNEIVPNLKTVRIVTNVDWAGDENESKKVIKFFSENDNVYISISFDKWHTNKFVDEAKKICDENNIPFNIACKEDDSDESIVPIGRSLYDSGFFGMFSCWCHNPLKKYSFLIDEKGIIYKCGFGVWDYANVDEYLEGGFSDKFKEFGEKFYDVWISSCRSCIGAYQKKKERRIRMDKWEKLKQDIDNAKNIDSKLDFIFDCIDDMLIAGEFSEVNEIIKKVDINKYDISLLLGFLTITLSAKNKLPYRSEFFMNVKNSYHKNDVNEMFSGLE